MKYLRLSLFMMILSVASATFGDCGCGCGKKTGPGGPVEADEEVVIVAPGVHDDESMDDE